MKTSEPVNSTSGTSFSEQAFSEITERMLPRATHIHELQAFSIQIESSTLVTYCRTVFIMPRLRIWWYIESRASNVQFFQIGKAVAVANFFAST